MKSAIEFLRKRDWNNSLREEMYFSRTERNFTWNETCHASSDTNKK